MNKELHPEPVQEAEHGDYRKDEDSVKTVVAGGILRE